MDEPLRLWPDSWDASVSVTDINSDPVLDFLKPDTVRWERLSLHMAGEDSRTHAFPVLPRNSSDPSGDVGPTDSGKPNICPRSMWSRYSM